MLVLTEALIWLFQSPTYSKIITSLDSGKQIKTITLFNSHAHYGKIG